MCSEISALMPTLKPTAYCIDEVLHRVHQRARSWLPTDAGIERRGLSTMLYSALTSMEMTMGSAIEVSSGKSVFFHKGIVHGFLLSRQRKNATTARRAIVWRKVKTVKIHTLF